MNSKVGVIAEETDFDDYREMEGVKLPGTIRLSAIDTQIPISTRKIEKIEFNVSIDNSKFDSRRDDVLVAGNRSDSLDSPGK